MKVKLIKENEDGSADFNIDMTKDEENALICHAIVKAIEDFVKNGEQYVAGEIGLGNPGSGREDCVYGACEQSCESGQPCNGAKIAGLSD